MRTLFSILFCLLFACQNTDRDEVDVPDAGDGCTLLHSEATGVTIQTCCVYTYEDADDVSCTHRTISTSEPKTPVLEEPKPLFQVN